MRWLAEMGVFARVVEAGGFAKAARQLGLTRSAVSKHVGRLEDGLGVRLLHRTTRAMSLTEAGRAVYEQCARLADAADEAVAAAGRLAAAPRGWLRLSTSVAYGHAVLVPALPGLMARYPELRVDLVLLDRNVDLAEEGFDLVLRLTDRPPEGLVARRLADVAFVACASPDYLAAYPAPAAPAALAGHNCLRQGHPSPASEWAFDGPGGSVTVAIDGNAVMSGSEGVRSLALAGAGCALLPDFMVTDDLATGRLLRLLPDWQPRARYASLYALYLPGRQVNPKVRACIDWLLERQEPHS
ncbi:MAG: LysR family transcriptional regulator [Gallionellaceae bacterium]|nr:LysR family transcriptional regulator [Gallionellaceae bacterium]